MRRASSRRASRSSASTRRRRSWWASSPTAGPNTTPIGEPTRTKTHDFVDKELGRAVPYGVYDLANDEGWVSVGDTADTASFAVEAIRRWWHAMGQPRFPDATKLLITADAGGSNGYRVRLWKVELAKLAQETGLEITVRHYPPGTSKWNRIEHKMFSFISMNWRGRPLVSYRTIIELISATTTTKGLTIRAERGPQLLRDRHQGHRRRTRRRAAHAPRLPRRLELHDRSIKLSVSPNSVTSNPWTTTFLSRRRSEGMRIDQ